MTQTVNTGALLVLDVSGLKMEEIPFLLEQLGPRLKNGEMNSHERGRFWTIAGKVTIEDW